MKLQSFGCSFIFGTDLSDDGRHRNYATGSHLTWPALLAKKMGLDYETRARPGAGNLQILERLMNTVVESDSLYVIGWTWIDRFDYVDHDLKNIWPGRTSWSTLMPIDNSDKAKMYYRHLHSEYRDKLSNLIMIKTAIDCLQQHNRRFIMTYMDHILFCREWHLTPAVALLQDQIRPYVTDFNGQNFLDWSRSNGFEISATMHPLEKAHAAAADLVFNDIDRRIKS